MSTDEKTGMGNETPSMSAEDEMAGLKKRAKMMGMTVSNNIGLETLRTRVRNVLESGKKPQEEEPEPEQEITPVAAALTKVEPKAAKVETESEKRKRIMKSAMRLIRIRITCLNPAKKDLPGQIVTVGNKYIGTVKKYVPFGNESGYHVPHIIYEHLKASRYQHIQANPNKNGGAPKCSDAVEFAIEVLPQLTPVELKKLALQQATAAGNVTE